MPPIALSNIRRGLLFLVAIGLPLCAGIVFEQPAGALLGSICGMLFSFADEEAALSRRFALLYLAAAAIGLGGTVGIWLHGYPPPLWVIFAAVVFACGLSNSIGKAPTMAGRFAAMAIVVTSGTPAFQFSELAFPVGALAVVSIARLIDHALAGPLPQQGGGARSTPAGGWRRYAIAYAVSATASLYIGIAIDPARVLWVVVTTLVVMQSDARASYVRIVHRIAGTVVGVVAAFALTTVLQAPWEIAAAALATAPLIPHHLQNRYWLHTALIALMVFLLYDLAAFDPRLLRGLFTERLQDVLLGAGIALIGTMVAFPRAAPEENA